MSHTLHRPIHRLRDLLIGMIGAADWAALPDISVTDIVMDSRACTPGCVFVAVPGTRAHGLAHVAQAISNGARVVLWQPDATVAATADSRAQYVRVPELTTHLGELANRFFGFPSHALCIAAVTGTNGKSTTAWLLAQAAERCGLPAGYIGTVGCGRVQQLQATTHTTADVFTVHRQLRSLLDAGAEVVAMEVSSHALDQERIAGVRVNTAVFTNLTQDHLDYHHSMQAYGEAKAKLFARRELEHQVINADDDFGAELLQRWPAALAFTCDVVTHLPALLGQVTLTPSGLRLQVRSRSSTAHEEGLLDSALLGRFNAENLLAALSVLLCWQVPLSQAVFALSQCVPPPGRMELIEFKGKRAVVDYAHTPDALEKALQALRLHCTGQLICVFGCGGDRDQAKRPLMGRVAAELADQIVLTDDNPRSENPETIIAAIRSGMHDKPVRIERDRAAAIRLALDMAAANDIVLVAGKGHEDYQLIGDRKLHFSDREVIEQTLRGAA